MQKMKLLGPSLCRTPWAWLVTLTLPLSGPGAVAWAQGAPAAPPASAVAASAPAMAKALREADGPRRRILEAAQQAAKAKPAGVATAPAAVAVARPVPTQPPVSAPAVAAPATSPGASPLAAPRDDSERASASAAPARLASAGIGVAEPAAPGLANSAGPAPALVPPVKPADAAPGTATAAQPSSVRSALAQAPGADPLATRPSATAPPAAPSTVQLVPPVAAAMAPGGGASALGAADQAYAALVAAEAERLRRYPTSREARALRPQGTVRLAVVVERTGAVAGVDLVSSAGSLLLDNEALRSLRQARFPPMPEAAFAGQPRSRFEFALEYRPESP